MKFEDMLKAIKNDDALEGSPCGFQDSECFTLRYNRENDQIYSYNDEDDDRLLSMDYFTYTTWEVRKIKNSRRYIDFTEVLKILKERRTDGAFVGCHFGCEDDDCGHVYYRGMDGKLYRSNGVDVEFRRNIVMCHANKGTMIDSKLLSSKKWFHYEEELEQ